MADDLAIPHYFLSNRVTVLTGDITQQSVDVIVNAANSSLYGGGGVDGAIHRAGGPQILTECQEIRRTQFPDGLPTSQAVITSAGRMLARHVIHTVGPIKGAHGDRDAELLASCYTNCLALAVKHTLRTIAFPAISTGIYGYPKDEAATVASRAIRDFLETDQTHAEVRLVFFSASDAQIFLRYQRFE